MRRNTLVHVAQGVGNLSTHDVRDWIIPCGGQLCCGLWGIDQYPECPLRCHRVYLQPKMPPDIARYPLEGKVTRS